MPSVEYKKRKVEYIKKYNSGHYHSMNTLFRDDNEEDMAMYRFLQSQKSTNKYVKDLIRKEMVRQGISFKAYALPSYEEMTNMTTEKIDDLITQYQETFGQLPLVNSGESIYTPKYIKLMYQSLQINKPYGNREIKEAKAIW